MKNKNHKLGLLIAFFLIIVCSITSILITQGNNSGKIINYNEPTLRRAGYWEIDPISINDNDLTRNWEITAATYEWCSGSGTINDPYVIENVTIDMLGFEHGIRISFSSAHFIIRNCVVYNSGDDPREGITLYHVENGKIINNTLFDTGSFSIYVLFGRDIIISNNTISNNRRTGIAVDNSNDCVISGNSVTDILSNGIQVAAGDNIIVKDNIIKNVENYGIGISWKNYNSIVEGNTISHAGRRGIFINRMCYFNTIQNNNISNCETGGIWILESQSNTVKNNNIYHNSGYGILLQSNLQDDDTANNNIIENIIEENQGIGVYIDENSFSNLIVLNEFINNEVNAEDNGINNQWDNGEIGNYWSDYSGMDADGDGIGDTPYNITGTANSVDNFPIWEEILPPEEYLEGVIDMLTILEVPEGAEHLIEKSILFLTQAKEKFASGMFYEAYDKIRDSMEFLMIAGDIGATIQEVIDSIMFLVQYIVDNAMEEVIDLMGEENKFIIRALEYYDTALLMLTLEDYVEAVRFFKLSYKNIMKAIGELISESFVDDLYDQIEKIQELKAGNIPSEALSYLNQAENKLLLAIEKANASLLSQSLYQLKDVVKNLLDTESFGVDTTEIVESILQNADDVTYLKIVEAESILMGESNRHLDKAWINYYKANDLWTSGKYEFALNYYARAIEKVNDALN